jgi:hypothetical protein
VVFNEHIVAATGLEHRFLSPLSSGALSFIFCDSFPLHCQSVTWGHESPSTDLLVV